MNSDWVASGSENHCETTKSLKIGLYYLFNINQERIYRTKISSTKWNDASTGTTASGPLWVTRSLKVLLANGVSVEYTLGFVLEVDILSTRRNKDDVMWQVWLFWKTISANHVCRYSVNHSNVYLIIALTAQSDTSNFPGNASTYFRWSGNFRQSFVFTGFIPGQSVQSVMKSVLVWQTRSKRYVGTVFWDAVYDEAYY